MQRTSEESVDKFVDNVEDELRSRNEEAEEKARKARERSDSNQSGVPYKSPPLIGGDIIEKEYGSDRVKMEFSQELPNGCSHKTLPLPSTDEIKDNKHELNRLLSLYDIKSDHIADMTNKRLPLIPVGDYKSPDDMSYRLDMPPVPTKPNMILYKLKRGLIKSKLIRVGRTPRVRRRVARRQYVWEDGQQVPHMDKSAIIFMDIFDWEKDRERMVPTRRATTLFILLTTTLSFIPALVSNSYIATIMTFGALLMSFILNIFPTIVLLEQFVSRMKKKYFPSTD